MISGYSQPVIIYFCAGAWTHGLPVGELRYPIYLISQETPVLFIEPPLTWRERLSGGRRIETFKKMGSLREVPDSKMNVFTPQVSVPYSVRLPLARTLKNFILDWNIKSVSRQVMSVFRRIFPGKEKPDIVWGTIFHHAGFLSGIPARHKLAIIDDNFPLSPVFSPSQKKEVARMERRLIKRSSAIFTTSIPLYEEKGKINPVAYMMENGVPELFLPENRQRLSPIADSCPAAERRVIEDIRKLPKPRIGYVGAVNIRLKMPLLRELLNLPAPCHTVFVGNVDDSFPRQMLTVLKKNPRIHFFPYISHALIPFVLEEFDVLLLPFEETPFSRFINPLKLSEYLTSGKPIIATPLAEVMRVASKPEGLVYFVDKPEELREMVARALAEEGDTLCQARINLARTRTWECTTREMRSVVENLLQTV
ncbi:MAG: glycosyltransferase [Candidatus Sumerlaeota bacterium]|nr:glycosyltransferase [Candidatus Sumerlaeota bacterium]